MQYAHFNGGKIEATKGAKGICPGCGADLIPRCGDTYINHWAHKGNRDCDPWFENETEWHRSWKSKFPMEWHEIVHRDNTGEQHRADVKTTEGWTIEFQHSFIKLDEIKSRNNFYKKIVWVVNGLRRKTDFKQFESVVKYSSAINSNKTIWEVNLIEECRLFREWVSDSALVFIDFGGQLIYFIFPKITNNVSYISYLPKEKFINLHKNNEFDALFNNIITPRRNELINIQKLKNQI